MRLFEKGIWHLESGMTEILDAAGLRCGRGAPARPASYQRRALTCRKGDSTICRRLSLRTAQLRLWCWGNRVKSTIFVDLVTRPRYHGFSEVTEMTAWTPVLEKLAEPKNAEALTNVGQLLDRLAVAFASNATVASMLDVDAAMVTRWRKHGAEISPQMRARIIDLHDTLNRALQVLRPRQAILWLFGSEPFLGGARPIDVLARKGAAPLIEALAGIESGGYA